MLNDAFDLMVPAVESHGGEILKFLGDGFFAIFPHDGDDGMAKTADAARAAVAESEAAVAGARSANASASARRSMPGASTTAISAEPTGSTSRRSAGR